MYYRWHAGSKFLAAVEVIVTNQSANDFDNVGEANHTGLCHLICTPKGCVRVRLVCSSLNSEKESDIALQGWNQNPLLSRRRVSARMRSATFARRFLICWRWGWWRTAELVGEVTFED